LLEMLSTENTIDIIDMIFNNITERIKLALARGSYEKLLEIARDIIVLEVRIYDMGLYEEYANELFNLKKTYITALALLTTRRPQPRKYLRKWR